jgi:hypothetical protein
LSPRNGGQIGEHGILHRPGHFRIGQGIEADIDDAVVWRRARFRSPPELKRLAMGAGLADASVIGAIFYPPVGIAARLLGPLDRRLGERTTLGAAFLVLVAAKRWFVLTPSSK